MFLSFKKLIAVLMTFALLLCFNGCDKKKLTNAYINYQANNNSMIAGSVVSEESVKQVESFANNIAVLPEGFKNSFDLNDVDNKAELLLVNDESNEVLYSLNSMEETANASTTKLLTSYIALKELDMNEVVTVKNDIILEEGAVSIYLRPGDQISVNDLMHGLLLASANDCAVVLAEAVSGSVENFAKLMNKTAKELGATHSHFMNPHGLDADGHYSCAYDLYLFLKHDLEIEEFNNIVAKKEYEVQYYRDGEVIKIPVNTTNKYINGEVTVPDNFTIIGGKTGTTTNAGHCLTLSAYNYNNERVIAIVLNTTDVDTLYKTMTELITENGTS
ncbi:MAG: serine hydrolase [Lachnospiraceae bacterium]|nr:serine hydrolase [Lachnospiraceae bacterium]